MVLLLLRRACEHVREIALFFTHMCAVCVCVCIVWLRMGVVHNVRCDCDTRKSGVLCERWQRRAIVPTTASCLPAYEIYSIAIRGV